MPTIAEIKDEIRRRLAAVKVETAECRREAELIVEHVSGLSLAQQMAYADQILPTPQIEAVQAILAERERRVPLSYCLGSASFMGLEFKVGPAVLIPRPETELLVEKALILIDGVDSPLIADIGTGSGAIAVTLAKLRPDSRLIAIDISAAALATARENAQRHGVAAAVEFFHGDWLSFNPQVELDMIVSNPPYIPLSQMSSLEPEVSVHEPKEALFGEGEDGAGFYRDLAQNAGPWLKPGAAILVELGHGQSDLVTDIFVERHWTDIVTYDDLNKIPRVLQARRAKNGFW